LPAPSRSYGRQADGLAYFNRIYLDLTRQVNSQLRLSSRRSQLLA